MPSYCSVKKMNAFIIVCWIWIVALCYREIWFHRSWTGDICFLILFLIIVFLSPGVSWSVCSSLLCVRSVLSCWVVSFYLCLFWLYFFQSSLVLTTFTCVSVSSSTHCSHNLCVKMLSVWLNSCFCGGVWTTGNGTVLHPDTALTPVCRLPLETIEVGDSIHVKLPVCERLYVIQLPRIVWNFWLK